MANITQPIRDLIISIPVIHNSDKPNMLVPKHQLLTEENIKQHHQVIYQATERFHTLMQPFTSQFITTKGSLYHEVALEATFGEHRLAQNVVFETYWIQTILAVKLTDKKDLIVELKLRPMEFLGHLITAGEKDCFVLKKDKQITLKEVRDFPDDENSTSYVKSLTYECAIADFDANQQETISKIIKATLTPFHILDPKNDRLSKKKNSGAIAA
jgi:hypothetical protein